MIQQYLGRTDFNSFTWQGKRSIHLGRSRPTLMVGKERMLELCSIVPVLNTSSIKRNPASIKRNPACNSIISQAWVSSGAWGKSDPHLPEQCQTLNSCVWSAAPYRAQEAEADFDWSRVAWVALPRVANSLYSCWLSLTACTTVDCHWALLLLPCLLHLWP